MPYKLPSSYVERLFFGAVITTGSAIAIASARELFMGKVPSDWMILATLTLLTGSFTIRIPRLSIRISVSDAFVFAAVLLFGGAVATVIVAVDSLVATLWMRRENRSVFRSAFNLSVGSLSIWTAATVFRSITTQESLTPPLHLTPLLIPLFVLACLYFLLNSWLIAAALAFQRSTSIWRLWWTHFPWFSLNYFGGASAAALLLPYVKSVDIASISIILPFLVISYLTYRASLGRVQDAERHLEQMNELHMSTIEALAMAVDAKDQITHGHIRRVQVYALELAKRLGVVDTAHLQAIETAALLHDMGKLAIPEYILNKPGKLSTTEFDKMKRHADIGADLLSSITFPYPVVPIVRHHHESWSGGGYPTGIAGTDIPLGARILSVVDCFDALTSDRPYRPKLSNDAAFEILRERRGRMYDPLVVDTFISAYSEIAPFAIRAGRDARSLSGVEGIATAEQMARSTSLTQIRSNAFEHSVLSELQRRVANVTTTDLVFDEIGRHLRQLTPATVFALFVHNSEGDLLTCQCTVGDAQQLTRGISIRVGERVTGWCASSGRPSLNSHAFLDLGPISELFRPALLSTMSVPLFWEERLQAVLSAYSTTPDAFTESHQHVFEQVGLLLTHRLRPTTLTGNLHADPQGKVVSFRGAL